MSRVRAIVELVLGVAAAVGAVAAWFGSQTVVQNASLTDSEPVTRTVQFYAPTLALVFVGLTLAGVLIVTGVARLRRTVVARAVPVAPEPTPFEPVASPPFLPDPPR